MRRQLPDSAGVTGVPNHGGQDIGTHALSITYAADILPREYSSWKFNMGVSCINAPSSYLNSVSTRNGDLFTIKLKGWQHVNNTTFDNKEIMPYSTPASINKRDCRAGFATAEQV